jgi:hypothetical protein
MSIGAGSCLIKPIRRRLNTPARYMRIPWRGFPAYPCRVFGRVKVILLARNCACSHRRRPINLLLIT